MIDNSPYDLSPIVKRSSEDDPVQYVGEESSQDELMKEHYSMEPSWANDPYLIHH